MSGTLSARFSQLKSADKLVGTGGSGKRSAGRVAVQNEQRSAQRQARRTGSAAVPVNGRAKVGAANGTGQKSGRRGRGKGGSGPTVAKKGKLQKKGRRGGDEKPVKSQEDLDKEMDAYWFKAGKGPNPDLASLDREMDDYFAKKGKDAGTAGATGAEAAAAETVADSDAAPSGATVTEA